MPACSTAATACAPTGTASTRPIRCSAPRRPGAGTPTSMLGWFYAGGGEALYNELVNSILRLNLVGFLYYPMPTQPLGWFKKRLKIADAVQGHEVPHRRPLRRPVQGDGRRGDHPAGRRDRAGARPRPDRRGRVQQSVVRHPARLPGRGEGLHDAAATTSRRNASRSSSTRRSSTRLPPELKAILRNAAHAASADQL